MGLSEIAKELGVSRQTISYNLSCMIKKGLIIRNNGSYFAQPFLFAVDIESEVLTILTELIQNIDVILDDEAEVDKIEALSNTVALLCQSIADNVRTILTQI